MGFGGSDSIASPTNRGPPLSDEGWRLVIPSLTQWYGTNTDALGDVTHSCSAGGLTGAIGGDEDIAATANVTRRCAFVLFALDPQCDVDGVPGCNEQPGTPVVNKRLRSQERPDGGVDPIRLVAAAGQVQQKILGVVCRMHNIGAWTRQGFVFAMVMIQSVLSSGITHPPAENPGRQAANHEVRIRTHLQEVEAVHELSQISQSTENLGVVLSVAGGVSSRKSPVQVIETSSASHDEFPRFHPRIGNRIALVPYGVPVGFV